MVRATTKEVVVVPVDVVSKLLMSVNSVGSWAVGGRIAVEVARTKVIIRRAESHGTAAISAILKDDVELLARTGNGAQAVELEDNDISPPI